MHKYSFRIIIFFCHRVWTLVFQSLLIDGEKYVDHNVGLYVTLLTYPMDKTSTAATFSLHLNPHP